MPSKPTIVFVPGAWHGPDGYAATMAELQSEGYPTISISLPSVGCDPPLQTFDEDVKAIRHAVQTAVNKGQEVVLVAHSYGSVPATQGLDGLEKGGKDTKGKGGVIRFFFCCAFVLPEGGSLIAALNGQDLPWWDVQGDTVYAKTPETIFYNDLSPATQDIWISSLRSFSYRMFYSELSVCAWRKIPSTYLYCEQDNAIPLPVQKMMVENSGVQFETETLNCSHSPFLSQPKDLTAAIRRSAGEKV